MGLASVALFALSGFVFSASGAKQKQSPGCPGAKQTANSHELNSVGVAHQGSGHLEEAEACYEEAIRKKPSYLIPYFNIGTLHMARNDQQAAIDAFSTVVRMQPSYASAYYNMGSAWFKLGEQGRAIDNFRLAVEVDPNYVNAHANLAIVLQMQGDLEGSKRHVEASLKIDPLFADGWMTLGHVLKALGQLEEAIHAYETAKSLSPRHGMALYNLGVAYWTAGRFSDAVSAYAEAIQSEPGFASAYYNMGLCYQALGRPLDAVTAFTATTALDPRSVEAYNNLGTSLDTLGRLPEAIKAYSMAMRLLNGESNAHEHSVMGNLFQSLQAVCDWRSRDFHFQRLVTKLETLLADPRAPVHTFHSLSYPFSAELALRIATHHAALQSPVHDRGFYRKAATELGSSGVLRVGYLVESARKASPLQQSLRTMLSMHDRERVHATVYCLQEEDPAMLDDLRDFGDEFRDLSGAIWHTNRRAAALEAADVIASDNINILLHLSDTSQGRRHEAVLSLRVAPIQVELGTVASTGAEYMDYFVSDPTVSPPDYQGHYSEKLVQLPHSALLIDVEVLGQLELAEANGEQGGTRSAMGLPAHGVLFCCFGEAFKVSPELFDVWMRLLARVAGSALWLPRYNALAEENLRAEASSRGLDPSRLVFSPPEIHCADGHCTRHSGRGALVMSSTELRAAASVADVILDTGPHMSSPAPLGPLLWAGLPCVTLVGERMTARRGASQLAAGLELEWLVAGSGSEYEEMAVGLGRAARARAEVGAALRAKRDARLFDARGWVVDFERSMAAMWEDYTAEWGTGGRHHIRMAARREQQRPREHLYR